MNSSDVTIFDKLKTLRTKHNISQSEMAWYLKSSSAYVSNLENGKIPNASFRAIDLYLSFFGLRLDIFTDFSNSPRLNF